MDTQTPIEVVPQPEPTLYTPITKFLSYFLLVFLSLGGLAFGFSPALALIGCTGGLACMEFVLINAIFVPIAWVLVYWSYRLIQHKFKLYRPKELIIVLISVAIVILGFPAIWMPIYSSISYLYNSNIVSKLNAVKISVDKEEIKEDSYNFSVNIINQGKNTFPQMPIHVGVAFQEKNGNFQAHIWLSEVYKTTIDIPPGNTRVNGNFILKIIQDSTVTEAYLNELTPKVYVEFDKPPYNTYPYNKNVGILDKDYKFVTKSTLNWTDSLKKNPYK